MNKLDYPENIGQTDFRNIDLNFLQDGTSEAFAAIFAAFSSETVAADGIKIKGCEITDNGGGSYSLTAGFIYLKGEIYRVDAQVMPAGAGTVYFDVVETDYDNAWPAPVKDGTSHQTRKQRRVAMVRPGATPPDYMPLNAPSLIKKQRDAHYEIGIPFWFDPTLAGKVMSDYFDLNTGEGLPFTDMEGYVLLGKKAGTEHYAGKILVSYHDGDADFGNFKDTGGEKTHTLIVDEIPAHTHQEQFGDFQLGSLGTSFPYGTDHSARVNNQDTGSAGGGQAHNNLQPFIVAALVAKMA